MKATIISTLAVVLVLAAQSRAGAQITVGKQSPVTYGHHHLTVTSIDAHKKFWVDTLGGKLIKVGSAQTEVIEFPEVIVFLRQAAPAGGTKGTTVNHIGFQVPSVSAMVAKLRAAGYPLVTRAELPPQYKDAEKDGQAFLADQNTFVAFTMAPDDVKVELVENKSMKGAIALHHIHFFTPQVPEMQAWYAKTFSARPGKRGPFDAADLPGVNLTFSKAADPVVGTKGRSLDHIGFEVRNLEAFTRQLESQGIKLDVPYRKVPQLGLAIAFITDPWGTYIELTEGLSAIE